MVSNIESRRNSRGIPMVRENLTYKGVPTSDYSNGEHEKPWQRVPSSLIIIVLGWYLLLGFLTQLIEDDMPRVVNEADLSRDNTDTFSEDVAWKYLHQILGNEPRVAGTAYHLNKTVDMKAMVDSIASQANQRVRTDWQIVTGDYYIRKAAPFVNLYVNASNVIALLEGESGFHSNGTLGSSVLVNCHYDSVPFAMGASDNAVFCAVMMEILSKFSKRTRKLKNNIVFLFNGAEEVGLMASHGFLKHPWAKGVTSVVNLDAAGMNGKPSVFQVTDPRLLAAYRRAVGRPSAQGLGEVLFSSGIIPSDTDFRIFRDFGGIQGIDIAFTKWGHVYHTRYDHPDVIKTGVIQNAGNMLMALLDELGDMDELDSKLETPTQAVYYDYLNLFMISHSMAVAYIVDVAICIFALLTIAYYIWLVGPRWSTIKELLFAVIGRFFSCICGFAVVWVPTSIMIYTSTHMRYLSEPWIVVPTYWVPYLVGAVAASEFYDKLRTPKSGLNRSIRTLQSMTASRLLIMLLLLVVLFVRPLQSTRYLISIPLFLMSTMSLVSMTVVRYVRLQGWQHLLMEVVLTTPTVMFLFVLVLRINSIMLPIMGRSPSDGPDKLVLMFNVACVILVAGTVSGIELLFSRRHLWLPLSVIYVVCVIIMFIPFSPFRDDGPATQRHYWFHTETVTYDINQRPKELTTGVAALKLDVYTDYYLKPYLTGHTSTNRHRCGDRIYCNLPLYRTSYGQHLSEAVWIDMPGPAPFTPVASLTTTKNCVGETCTYNFTMNGATHNTITLWPRPYVNITAWSLDSPVNSSFHQLERPVYVIIHALATYEGIMPAYNFNVTCHVPLFLQTQPALDVTHMSHKIHHPEDFTDNYKNFLNTMPKFFNIASFLTFRHNYLF